MNTINIQKHHQFEIPHIYIRQSDTSNVPLRFKCLDGFDVCDVSNYNIKLVGRDSTDKKIESNNASIIDAKNGIIELSMNKSMLTNSGTMRLAYVQFKSKRVDGLDSSHNIVLHVMSSVEGYNV